MQQGNLLLTPGKMVSMFRPFRIFFKRCNCVCNVKNLDLKLQKKTGKDFRVPTNYFDSSFHEDYKCSLPKLR